MNVTGRPAQFGRGVMVEVGGKLVQQFATNLAQLIAGDTGSGAATEGPAAGGGASATPAGGADGASASAATADAPSGNGSAAAAGSVASMTNGSAASAAAPAQEDSLNLVTLVGPVVLKRLVPVVAGVAALALLGRIFWRLRHRQAEEA